LSDKEVLDLLRMTKQGRTPKMIRQVNQAEKQEAEEVLREAQARLRDSVRNVADLMIVVGEKELHAPMETPDGNTVAFRLVAIPQREI
jgi:hypothetical protein